MPLAQHQTSALSVLTPRVSCTGRDTSADTQDHGYEAYRVLSAVTVISAFPLGKYNNSLPQAEIDSSSNRPLLRSLQCILPPAFSIC